MSLSLAVAPLTLGSLAYAKSAGSVEMWQQGHSQDMAMVVGLTKDSPQALKLRWEEITNKFAQCIDNKLDAAACLGMVRQIIPAFSWHGYGHRVFFHWGFNSFPQDMGGYKKDVSQENAMVICIEEALLKEPEETREKLRKQVWNRLRGIQSSRNRSMMNVIPAADRDTKGSIAAILYDVHLLGDYIEGEEKTCKALYPLSNIKGDIINAVNRMRVKDDTAKKRLVKALNGVAISGSAYMSKDAAAQKAEQLLNILIANFPDVVRQSPSYESLMGV